MDKKGLKTADFAKLCNTTKRTLQYYDSIGLFQPMYTEENGYRYYSASQCDFFFTIQCLADIGMSLTDIRTFCERRNPLLLKEILLQQIEKVHQEQARLARIESIISTKIEMVDTGMELLRNELMGTHPAPMCVEIQDSSEEYFVVSRRMDTDQPDLLLNELCMHIHLRTQKKLYAGAPYSAILASGDWMKGLHNYAYYAFKIPEPLTDDYTFIKPAGKYAVYYLRGDFHYADDAIYRLLDYCTENAYPIGPYIFKEAVLDEVSEKESRNYITKISIRIQ